MAEVGELMHAFRVEIEAMVAEHRAAREVMVAEHRAAREVLEADLGRAREQLLALRELDAQCRRLQTALRDALRHIERTGALEVVLPITEQLHPEDLPPAR